MTSLSRRTILATAFAAAIGSAMAVPAASAGDMRIAFGDLPGIESIQTLAAIERAKERGVNVELIILNDEDLAAQAIVGNQADVGIGAPYTLIQKVGVPIRLFAQISTLRFFPVVNAEFYKEWKDLDGQEVAVQARGSGTEAVMLLMAKNNGITLGTDQLCPGLGSPAQRPPPGHDQGLDRRRGQPARARGGGPRQVHRAAGRKSQRNRRRALRHRRISREGRGRRRHPGRGTDEDRRARLPRIPPPQSSSATNTSSCPISAPKPTRKSRNTTRRPPRPAAWR